ncbi:MAG: tetratricopeptide repeat protein [Candidatus Competibacteraceae bacterium]|nr:tetratricopeptide repeat protein [Candidatus Competibacteraceae bacterium]
MSRSLLAVCCCAILGGCVALERLSVPAAPAPSAARAGEMAALPATPTAAPDYPTPRQSPVERAAPMPEASNRKPPNADAAHPGFLEDRARQAYETGRLDVAEGYYLQLIRLRPKDAAPWFHLGNLYSEQGRLDSAERAYRESLRRRDDARTLHNLGLSQVKLGVGALREAQKRMPPDDPARRETQEFLRILLESIGK